MRLLNIHTLEFGEFYRYSIPPYGILSHTWSSPANEVSYKDFVERKKTDTSGWKKIINCCDFFRGRKTFNFDAIREARPEAFEEEDREPRGGESESLNWVWIDTCCIDKTSSAELSEAINSMFAWYYFAEECVIYLSDIEDVSAQAVHFRTVKKDLKTQIQRSRWFTRGWTLQELLASKARVFSSSNWNVVGRIHGRNRVMFYCKAFEDDTIDIKDIVSGRTGIPSMYLEDCGRIKSASIATRMSWAAKRDTTRVEDISYCLLGIFDVTIPLLYGEDRKAFIRLQEEIIRTSNDQSVFVWQHSLDPRERSTYVAWRPSGILANDIRCFESCADVKPLPSDPQYRCSINNVGLKMRALIRRLAFSDDDAPPETTSPFCFARLGQAFLSHGNLHGDIALIEYRHTAWVDTSIFYRSRCNDIGYVTRSGFREFLESGNAGVGAPLKFKIHVRKTVSFEDECWDCAIIDGHFVSRVQDILPKP